MEPVDAVTTPSVVIGRKMLSRVVTSDSENESGTDVPDPICKTEPGRSGAEQQLAAELRPRELLTSVVAFAWTA
jgi:hypothetical protein